MLEIALAGNKNARRYYQVIFIQQNERRNERFENLQYTNQQQKMMSQTAYSTYFT